MGRLLHKSKGDVMLNIYPIGIIYSPYKKIEDCPHNGWISKNVCNIQ